MRGRVGAAHGAILSIAFTSARSGWASEGDANGTPGAVLRTDDGGRTWRPQQVGALQIAVKGRLVPAPAGTSVEIGYRPVSGGSWKHELVAVSPGGTFSLGASPRVAASKLVAP